MAKIPDGHEGGLDDLDMIAKAHIYSVMCDLCGRG